HPQPAAVVKRDVHRLVDVRLGCHQLNLEARRQMKSLAFLLRGSRLSWGDVLREGVVLILRTAGACDYEKHNRQTAQQNVTHYATPPNAVQGVRRSDQYTRVK